MDRWGSKFELLLIPILLPLLTYVILLIAPKIDPKKRLNEVSNKYGRLKLLMVGLMSFITVLIIYATQQPDIPFANIITASLGLLLLILGNYMQTIGPNYFIGFRTPWTLSNDEVWEKTHRLGGRIWFLGGLLIILISLLFTSNQLLSFGLIMTIVLVISIVPYAYSYRLYSTENSSS